MAKSPCALVLWHEDTVVLALDHGAVRTGGAIDLGLTGMVTDALVITFINDTMSVRAAVRSLVTVCMG